MAGEYKRIYDESINNPEAFWKRAAEEIDWYKEPTKILDASNKPFYRWFVDGEMNTCYNAVDRHVETGRADQLALIYDSPVTGKKETYTYGELLSSVSKFAGALSSLGVKKGDRVVI